LSYNKIGSLPDEVVGLQLLERLNLTNNDLAILPFTLGLLPHLKTVQAILFSALHMEYSIIGPCSDMPTYVVSIGTVSKQMLFFTFKNFKIYFYICLTVSPFI
jgi:hypothetical protein